MQTLEGIRTENLDLEWKAVYENGEVLKQKYGTKNEKNFGHIDLDKVKEFWLGASVCVNMKEQYFIVNGLKFYVEFPRNKSSEKVKGKLVYFRRIRNDFAPTGTVISIRYCLGLQANIDGVNYQQYLFINNDGSYTLSQKK